MVQPIQVPASTQNDSIVLIGGILNRVYIETLPYIHNGVGRDGQIKGEDFLPDDGSFLQFGNSL
jgi:hypothetical protein